MLGLVANLRLAIVIIASKRSQIKNNHKNQMLVWSIEIDQNGLDF
jgi:hypothetical protein